MSIVEVVMNETNTLRLLTAALRPTEQYLFVEYRDQLIAQYSKFVTQLTADGMDAQLSYAYPSSAKYPSRKEYKAQVARYNYCNAHTTGVKATRSPYEPNIRVLKQDTTQVLETQALKMARAALAGFAAKLAVKIDMTEICAVKIEYVGGVDVWGYSHVKVNGGEQVWLTKMIVNVSCLGNLFNQWPTTLLE